jgi:hypothetical protein
VGRVKDCTLRCDGRIVTPAEVDDALALAPSAERIVSYQLEQLRVDELRVRVTSTGAIDAGAIAARLRGVYGESSRVSVERVRALVPEPSGKYIASRTRLDGNPDAWFDAVRP